MNLDKNPVNEQARLAALYRYQIMDTPMEPLYDELTTLACFLCETPYAAITFIDSSRQWFKSVLGVSINEVDRPSSFCTHAIQQRGTLVVPDAMKDPRFAKNPFVHAPFHLRFYAGASLLAYDDNPIGTICVFDAKPRALRVEQEEGLGILARQTMALLNLRSRTASITPQNRQVH